MSTEICAMPNCTGKVRESNVHKPRTFCTMNPASTPTGCDSPELHHPFTTADDLLGTPCLVCGAPVRARSIIGSGADHERGCPSYDCGCDWDSRAANPRGCPHGDMSLRVLARHPHACSGPCRSLTANFGGTY